MARITVVATEHPVPLPDGRFVRTAAEEPDGIELELDMFVHRRIDAGELYPLAVSDEPPAETGVSAVPAAPTAPVATSAPDPKPAKPTAKKED